MSGSPGATAPGGPYNRARNVNGKVQHDDQYPQRCTHAVKQRRCRGGHPGRGRRSITPGSTKRSNALRGRLAAAGASPGTTVSIILPNGLDFVVVFLAVARCGAVAAPLNPAYTVDEFKFYMEDASSGLAILPAGDHPGREAAEKLGRAMRRTPHSTAHDWS